jgi:hypothetical protein
MADALNHLIVYSSPTWKAIFLNGILDWQGPEVTISVLTHYINIATLTEYEMSEDVNAHLIKRGMFPSGITFDDARQLGAPDVYRLLERVKPLLDAGLANIPDRRDGTRVVGFKLPEEVARLSDGLFMIESAQELLKMVPGLLKDAESKDG